MKGDYGVRGLLGIFLLVLLVSDLDSRFGFCRLFPKNEVFNWFCLNFVPLLFFLLGIMISSCVWNAFVQASNFYCSVANFRSFGASFPDFF